MIFIHWLIVSVVVGVSAAILFVNKKDEFPIKPFNDKFSSFLFYMFGPNFAEVLNCSVCLSFWTTLIVELFVYIISGGSYFFWPLSGLVSSAILILIYDFLDTLGSE